MIIDGYLQAIEQNLARGNATEHTHRPALKTLLEGAVEGIVATNEPRRIACGAPDFSLARSNLTIGYVEAKDVGASLGDVERSEQLRRYRRYLGNLLLTDGLDFRWYVEGELRQDARLGTWSDGKLRSTTVGKEAVGQLLAAFLTNEPEPVVAAQELARHMARLTHMIRDVVVQAFRDGHATGDLAGLRQAFAATLLPELADETHLEDFADMYAQTLAYGLFAARVNHDGPAGSFDRYHAAHEIPKTNPLLRQLFDRLTGTTLDDEPHVGFVNDLVQLLSHAKMDQVLKDFGRRTRQEDPVVHFYETFLQQYDPALRELRGVYYTPQPVVDYIVRSVDWLLREKFGLADGLADRATVTVTRQETGPDGKVVERQEQHPRVLILDPACGTGTFLYQVVDQIRESFRASGNAGMWPGYVREHLLPRLFGFELLMAPYAVAHLKLGMQLAGLDLPEEERRKWAYDFAGDERLRVYLTNTLEEAEREVQGLFGVERALAQEATAAAEVKRELPIMVVLGNPPYSNFGSQNQFPWIMDLVRQWKPPEERKWNPDDYMKFLRWAQWRVEQTGQGVVAMITNRSFLDRVTHRGMRRSFLDTFDEAYVLDLHGGAYEATPAGETDQNVFDIHDVGVAIIVLVKHGDAALRPPVRYREVWGSRAAKDDELRGRSLAETEWDILPDVYQESCLPAFHFLAPRDFAGVEEYCAGISIRQACVQSGPGAKAERDSVAIHYSRAECEAVVDAFSRLPEDDLRLRYGLGADSRDWSVAGARADVAAHLSTTTYERYVYRPMDVRIVWYSGQTRGMVGTPSYPTLRHMVHPNVSIVTTRQTTSDEWGALIVDALANHKSVSAYDINTVFPLYQYPAAGDTQMAMDDGGWPPGPDGRTPNLDPAFVRAIADRLALTFISDGQGDLSATFGPEDIFDWIYGIFHAPGYRARYAEFLKIDFPRVPLTDDLDLWRAICGHGRELVRLHLLRDIPMADFLTTYPEPGENVIARGFPKYIETKRRVRINERQWFDGVAPEVWEFQVGGYQPLQKWLKDRVGRALADDDLLHYQRVVVALSETIRIMADIDAVIEARGGWPLPGQVPAGPADA